MTSIKIEDIWAWSTREKIVDVESVMCFANLHLWLLKGFSKIAKPLGDLTKKGMK